MKKGSKIKIVEYSKEYKGTTMDWTETFTGYKTIGVGGEWCTHTSDKLIKKFVAKEICLHPSLHSEGYFESTCKKEDLEGKYTWDTFIYAIFLPEGTIVSTYSSDEYRIDIDESNEFVFCGKVTEFKSHSEGKYNFYKKYSDTKKVK